MKRFPVAYLMMLSLICYAGSWYTFKSPDNRWSASFPSKPLHDVQKNKDGSVISEGWSALNDRCAFSVSESSAKRQCVSETMSAEEILAAYRPTHEGSGKSGLINSTAFYYQGYPAADFICKPDSKGLYFIMRVVVAGEYSYLLTVASVKQVYAQQMYQPFFNSFALAKSREVKNGT